MIMMNKENYINGNTVLAPIYEPEDPFKKQKIKKLKKLNNKKLNIKIKFLSYMAMAFIVGLILVFRYTSMYSVEKNLTNIKNETINLNQENDDMKVQLVNVSSLDNVQKIATEQLHMVKVNQNQVIYADLTKENFTKVASANDPQLSMLRKIYNMLF